MPQIRGWVGGRGVERVEGEGGRVNDALRHRRPSCVHSGPQQLLPYHEESRCRVEQFESTCHLIKTPQWPHRVCDCPAWPDRVGKKLSVKADLLIYRMAQNFDRGKF